MDHSFVPDPNLGGTYYRRIEDIRRGLEKLGIPAPGHKAINFIAYFFGSEKLAIAIVGIHQRRAAIDVYKPSFRLRLVEIKSAATALQLPFSADDLTVLFADHNEQKSLETGISARGLRHKLVHDFGPTNVSRLANHADLFIPKMLSFLGCEHQILKYLIARSSG